MQKRVIQKNVVGRSMAVLSVVVLSACGAGGVGSADHGPTRADALDEESVLEFLNGPDASEYTLVQGVRLQTRTAGNIVVHVRGTDRMLGTADDDLLDDIDELDAIPLVGPASIEALKAYVRAHYQTVDLVVEDVAFSSAHAREVVQLANEATEALLDDEVGLDTRAVNAIVAARPIANVHVLAAVSYVGTTALTRMRDWVIAHPPTTPPPAAGAVRIVQLGASQGYGMDPYWEEHNDGVFMTWASENAAECTAELLSAQGVVYATRGADRGLLTGDSGYFFGELGNHGGEDIDVRMTCKDAAGNTTSSIVRAGHGPNVVSAVAAITTAQDPVTQVERDGALVRWVSEMAVGCAVEIVTLTGESLALRDGLETAGEVFVATWDVGAAEESDVKVICTDENGAPVEHFIRVAPSTGVDCGALTGGTFDGVAFTAEQECTAVTFLNEARFSEMGPMPDAGRRIAYDCAPSGLCGFRSSQWAALSQYAGFSGVGSTSLTGLKAAIDGWAPTGLRWDTIANLWANRAALKDQPVNLDSVYVVRRLADQGTTTVYACVEVRDAPGAPNFMTACLAFGHDSSPIINASAYLDGLVGTQVALRGTLRQSSSSTGGYRITMISSGAGAPNPAVQ